MMLANVFAKTTRDRWMGWVIAVVGLALMLLMSMAVYRDIDLSIYDTMPEYFRSVTGISAELDAGSLAIDALYGLSGALVLAFMAIAMGASSIAGEERNGTMGLLLANPQSRIHVLVSKAASMVMLTAGGVLFLWAAAYLVSSILGVSITGMNVGAFSFHMFVNSLFYGFLAMAIGGWTGSRGMALGVTGAIMVMSVFAVGVLPLVEGLDGLVRVFPWHYYNGGDPLLNGINWGHIGVLLTASLVFGATAAVGLNRRDLMSRSAGVSLADRLRRDPMTRKVIGRLAGSTRVSGIWVKTATEYQTLLTITGAIMFTLMGVLMGPMYASIPEETIALYDDLPEALVALGGAAGGDLSTPEGWYHLETFGMMAPISVMVVVIAMGAGAVAGEESRRTMSLLLANPVERHRIVLEKGGVMVLYAFIVGLLTFAGVSIGSLLGDMGIDVFHIAASCLLQVLVGLVFGALALALSAATGRTRIAVFGAVGAALGFHVLNSFAQLSETAAVWARLSPFYYYLGNDPLNNGMDWSNGAVLAVLAASLIALSVVLFQRRDIRLRG